MPTYIGLINWTDAGERNIKDTVRRAEGTKAALQRMGVTVRDIFWTHGTFDVIIIVEAPDDETLWGAVLSIRSAGYFRGETFRAYNEEEMQDILSREGQS